MPWKPRPCHELTCTGLIAWLKNQQTGALVPADWDSLDTDEKEAYARNDPALVFLPAKHRSHFKTCTKPGRFGRKGKA